mmetsp:Transcript_35132/g.104881  ORF Transcript_35132/g.104881 Transcript_35132/m.104881 type:complete len:255 (+) Transcript_35132:1348-2112(+)
MSQYRSADRIPYHGSQAGEGGVIPPRQREGGVPRGTGIGGDSHTVDVPHGRSEGTTAPDDEGIWSGRVSDRLEGEIHRLGTAHGHVVPSVPGEAARVQEIQFQNLEAPIADRPPYGRVGVFPHLGVGSVETVKEFAAVGRIRPSAQIVTDDPIGMFPDDIRIFIGRKRCQPQPGLHTVVTYLGGYGPHRLVGITGERSRFQRVPIPPGGHVPVVNQRDVEPDQIPPPSEGMKVLLEGDGVDLLVVMIPRAPTRQ